MGRWDKKKQKNTLNDDIYKELLIMYQNGKGRSRNKDKDTPGATKNRIYSTSTYEGYKRQCKRFSKWLKKEYPEIKHLNKVKIEHVNEYLQSMIEEDLSASSISTSKAAIAKVLHVSSEEFIKTPERYRKDIKRSRNTVKRDKNISEETERKFAKLTSAIGGRRREMEALKGTDLAFNKHGEPFVYIKNGKGGKKRYAMIIGETPEETEEIVQIFKQAGKLKICSKLPSAFDNHFYRGIYAKRIYNRFAKPEEKLPDKRKYIMRKDRAGEVLDRRAMKITSRCLGHNRIDIIARHYLYN